MLTEQQVLTACMHNSDKVLEEVFFPQFQHTLEVVTPIGPTGYYSALAHIKSFTFDEWKKLRYREFRRARYASLAEQMDMRYHDEVNGTTTFVDHITSVKETYSK